MPTAQLVKSILASASSSSSTFVKIKYFGLAALDQENDTHEKQIVEKQQIFSFAKNKLSSGLLVVEKDQKNLQQIVVSTSNPFASLTQFVDSTLHYPHKLFVIASNGKMNHQELTSVKQVLFQLVDRHDTAQINSMTCDSAFVFVYHGVNNQYSLEVNHGSCILNLKLNSVNQNYYKRFNHLQALVLQQNQSKPLDSFVKSSQTVTHDIRIKNNGIIAWPQSIQLLSSFNSNVIIKSISSIPCLLPKEETIIQVELEYKQIDLDKQMIFRLSTANGHVFSDPICITPIVNHHTHSYIVNNRSVTNLISGGSDAMIKEWNIASKQLITSCNHDNTSQIYSVIRWNKELVIGGFENGDIQIWNTITQQLECSVRKRCLKGVLCLYKFDELFFL